MEGPDVNQGPRGGQGQAHEHQGDQGGGKGKMKIDFWGVESYQIVRMYFHEHMVEHFALDVKS